MKKILLLLSFSTLMYSQTGYQKIQHDDLNKRKVQLSKDFIESYLTKCANKDYSEFANFNLSPDHKKFMNQKMKEICTNDNTIYGTLELENLNSAYKATSSVFGGNELYIFDAKTEKDEKIKYLSVWISKENQIDGMVITSYKPFKKKTKNL